MPYFQMLGTLQGDEKTEAALILRASYGIQRQCRHREDHRSRILGKIYKELGVLKRGDVFVECTRSDLVGKYQGHTAEQVKNKVKEAMGGILFIDEAYSLCRDANDAFGREAVDALVGILRR